MLFFFTKKRNNNQIIYKIRSLLRIFLYFLKKCSQNIAISFPRFLGTRHSFFFLFFLQKKMEEVFRPAAGVPTAARRGPSRASVRRRTGPSRACRSPWWRRCGSAAAPTAQSPAPPPGCCRSGWRRAPDDVPKPDHNTWTIMILIPNWNKLGSRQGQ